MLISPHSSSPRWMGSNSGHYSSGLVKRKRSSCSSEHSQVELNSQGSMEAEGLEEKEGTNASSPYAGHKRVRRDDRNAFAVPSTPTSQTSTHVSTPTPARHLPPLNPTKNHTTNSNSWSILNQNHQNKPPTIDEVRTWATASTPTPTSSFLPSSPSRWTKIETSYGHKMVDLNSSDPGQPHNLMSEPIQDGELRPDEEMRSDEEILPATVFSSENEVDYHARMGSDSSMQMQLEDDPASINDSVASPPETYMMEGMSMTRIQSPILPHLITPMSPGVSSPVPFLTLNVPGRTGHPHPYMSAPVDRW